MRLRRLGWEVSPEVSYSEWGERGSIDLLGARVERRAMVVEEVKSDLTRAEETLRKLDEKVRLVAGKVGYARLGWRPRTVGRILVLPDTDRARRQVRTHAAVFEAALPARVRGSRVAPRPRRGHGGDPVRRGYHSRRY